MNFYIYITLHLNSNLNCQALYSGSDKKFYQKKSDFVTLYLLKHSDLVNRKVSNKMYEWYYQKSQSITTIKYTNLFIVFTASKSKKQQMPMRISAGKMVSIWWKFTVKHCTMALAFNLKFRSHFKSP